CEVENKPAPANAATSAPAHAGTGASQALDPALLETVKQKLAHYVGPIAGLVVTRAVKRAKNRRELYDLAAAEIPSAKDRESFLASLPL
ncbi:MAG: hypothetical protein ACRD9L_18430, partial [Bryobacteraceae bacterium]